VLVLISLGVQERSKLQQVSGSIRCSGGGLSNVVTDVTMTNTQSIGGHMTVTSTDENITVGFAVLLMANNDTDAYFDVDAEL